MNAACTIQPKCKEIKKLPLKHSAYELYDCKNKNDYIEIKGELNASGFDCEKALIEEAILLLQSRNPRLIHYTAAQLVEITHKWTSWKYDFEIATLLGKGSAKIDIDSICNDYKIYE